MDDINMEMKMFLLDPGVLVSYGIADSDVGNDIPASYMIQYPDYPEQHNATETNESLELKLHRGNVSEWVSEWGFNGTLAQRWLM